MATLHEGGTPSEQVVEDNARHSGKDFGSLTEGPYPVEELRHEKTHEELSR